MEIEINGEYHPIRNKCDYRVVLDVICALDDEELTTQERAQCALFIFYEDVSKIDDFEVAIKEMYRIINGGNEDVKQSSSNQRLMDWEFDFQRIAPPVSRVIGYDIRMPDKFTHWYSFLGAYMEIGDCCFSTIVSIRSKIAKNKTLEKWEENYLREHKKIIEIPKKFTAEEREILNSEW